MAQMSTESDRQTMKTSNEAPLIPALLPIAVLVTHPSQTLLRSNLKLLLDRLINCQSDRYERVT